VRQASREDGGKTQGLRGILSEKGAARGRAPPRIEGVCAAGAGLAGDGGTNSAPITRRRRIRARESRDFTRKRQPYPKTASEGFSRRND